MQFGSKENAEDRFNHYFKKTFKKTASLIAHSCEAVCSQIYYVTLIVQVL